MDTGLIAHNGLQAVWSKHAVTAKKPKNEGVENHLLLLLYFLFYFLLLLQGFHEGCLQTVGVLGFESFLLIGHHALQAHHLVAIGVHFPQRTEVLLTCENARSGCWK